MNEIVTLICDKLLSDGTLLKKVNELNIKINIRTLSEEYIKAVLNLVSRQRNDFAASDFGDMDMGIFGGIIYRRMKMATAGDIIKSHKHSYDHFTYIEKGTVDINGEIYKATQWARIPKDVIHTIKALTDDCVTYCINSEHEVLENS